MSSGSSGRTSLIWRDGQLVPWESATIHVMSHVVHYGSSVFEGVRCYNTPSGPAIFRLRDHIVRLRDSCRIYRIVPRHDVDALVQACVDTVAANEVSECYLRPIVVRTGEQMGIYPVELPAETFIIAWRWGRYLGDEALDEGIDAGVSSWRRPAPDTIPALAKAGGNYLGSQLAKMEARVNRYAEGIVLDVQGHVGEGSGENIFLVRDGVLYTSPLSAGILQGITRDSVIRIAHDLGIEVREMEIPREMLYIADELFFSGTAAELTPIRSVDRIQVGEGKPGPITRSIQEQFMGIATGRIEDRHGWLTPVGDAVEALR
jgi:branched-chain amino acid aminotransferase